MAKKATRAKVTSPVASAARGRSRKRAPDTSKAILQDAASPVSVPAVAVVEIMSDDDGTLILPIRFQCPLCFDVLRRPIQLPCCQRHLCEECFQRALEITSSNCGFCRKRIVSLARKKQYKVDESLWGEIRRCCPFVLHANGATDSVVDVEFVDENAPTKQRMVDAENEAAAIREAELTMSQKTNGDNHDHDHSTLMIAVDVAVDPHFLRSSRESLQPLEPASASNKHKQQRRLESFFGMDSSPSSQADSRPSSAGSIRSLRSTNSSSSSKSIKSSSSSSSSRGVGRSSKRRIDAVGKKTTTTPAATRTTAKQPLLRSSSQSPKRRKPPTVQRTLLQLTLHSPMGTRATRQLATPSSSKATTSKTNRPLSAGSIMTTRPRQPWRCRHCTFENTCFDTRCSMCQRYPAHAPVLQ